MKKIPVGLIGLVFCTFAFANAKNHIIKTHLYLPKSFTKNSLQKQHLLTNGVIAAGAGYSMDAQQIAPVECFSMTQTAPTNGHTILSLDTAKSFNDLQQQLHINVSLSGGYGMFSASAEANYMRNIEDKDYSMSLNYYEYSSGTTSVQPNGYGNDALNKFGLSAYQNGSNKYFGVTCGDQYINSYQEGTMLIMSININFTSHYEKTQFEAKAGASFGSFASAAASIQKIATENHMQGSVDIQAYQAGGDPSQLSSIISPDKSGKFSALTCDLQNMGDCVAAAGKLLAYAGQQPTAEIPHPFLTQFSYSPAKGLAPLGTGFMHSSSIATLGLQPPASLVPTGGEIDQDRQYLANELKQNQYYQQKFHELIYGYPVPLDTMSNFYKTSQKLLWKANTNVNNILQSSNPEAGALACYDNLYDNTSNNCQATTKKIKQQTQNIATTDISYLTHIQYIYPYAYTTNVSLIPNGTTENGSKTEYFCEMNPKNYWHSCILTKVEITPSIENFVAHVNASTGILDYYWNAQSTNGGKSYTGDFRSSNGQDYGIHTGYRKNNPFYFTAYTLTEKLRTK